MNKESVEKLQRAGYVFLRERDIPGKCGVMHYAIMQSKTFGNWSILEKFDKKVARKRRLKQLSELSNILTD
jgi:hypothetical protein